MENEEGDEPANKKRNLNSPMAKTSASPPDSKAGDAAFLQHQNQKLFQQLDAQRNEMHALEGKFKELEDKQVSYDETLITVNRLWNQLVDDLILLGLRAGGYGKGLQALDQADRSRGSIPSCPPEETFLYRLLEAGPTENSGTNATVRYIEEALASRHSSTIELMKHLEETINAERAKSENVPLILGGKLPAEEAAFQLSKIDDSLREEANNLRKVIDVLHVKHKEYADEIQKYIDGYSTDQSQIKRLAGELEDGMIELEESRRKLVNLKMQKDGASGVHIPVLSAVNGVNSPDKPADRVMRFRELKESVEEAKMLASTRLSELEEAREYNLILSEQMQKLQKELEDDKYIVSSKPYSLLSDRIQHLNADLDRYKGLSDSLQAERNYFLRREKELNMKVEAADAVRGAVGDSEFRIEELKLQLQNLILERNDLEVKLEEAEQDSGRQDIKAEFRVMASALSKEMEMMKLQLKRCKEMACEALSLREETHSLRALLDTKMSEHKSLSDRCDAQTVEIKSLKALIENLQKEKQELQIFLDMYEQGCYDNRDVTEIKESERRARLQAEMYQTVLDEHSLELRVKAATEAEAACHQRLSAAEVEIADLREKLDASERQLLELTEAIKIKDEEAGAYISEIETIGQAYEDMQTQNQHLLQQVTERDDYNIKLVSESVKIKQAQSSLLFEKQTLAKQLQQAKATLDLYKQNITHNEEQLKASMIQAAKTSLDNRHAAIELEKAKLESADVEKEVKWLRSAVDSSEKEYEQNQRKIVQLRKELEAERAEKKKMEDELVEWNSKVAELSSENREAMIQKLQDEMKECKAILKCGVCFDRPKEVVITKCYHLFCYPCIQRNLEIRHRKCPGCGTPFGQNDVREVKI